MDFSSLYHRNESIYSYATSEKELKITLRTKHNDDIKKVFVLYNSKYKLLDEQKEVEISSKLETKYFDFYYIYLKVDDVRVGYIFKIITNDNKQYFYSEGRLISEGSYDYKKAHYDYFQLPYINSSDIVRVNSKFKNRCFYQIFVDRFFDGEDKPINDKINVKWGENDKINRLTFAGGNLKGITQKLDYLKELGINALYLTPIFESYSNHKYETYDYYKIAKDFGDETTFKELVEEAHKRDILIVLDGVFNHVAFYNPMFEDAVKNGKASKYYSWFMIHNNDDKVDLDKVNFESFGFGKFMPKLNLNNLDTINYVIGICKYYLSNYHIDGYRMDVSDEIPHKFWKKLRFELEKIDPNIFLIGENWHDGHAFVDDGSEFDSLMNYPFTSSVLDFLAYKEINEEEFVSRINMLKVKYKDASNHNMINLLDSHDTARFINLSSFNEDRTLIAFSLLYLYTGIPMIYYGDEIGIGGNNDPDCRKMFIWDESKWNKKRFNSIKTLINIHKTYNLNNYDFNIEYSSKLLKVTIYDRNNNKVILNELINTCYDEVDVSMYLSNKKVLLQNHLESNILKRDGFVIYE